MSPSPIKYKILNYCARYSCKIVYVRVKKKIFFNLYNTLIIVIFYCQMLYMCTLGTKICVFSMLFYRNFSADAPFTRRRHSHHCCHLLTCSTYPREVYTLPPSSHRAMSAGYRSGNMPGEVLLQWFSCCVNQRTQQVILRDT